MDAEYQTAMREQGGGSAALGQMRMFKESYFIPSVFVYRWTQRIREAYQATAPDPAAQEAMDGLQEYIDAAPPPAPAAPTTPPAPASDAAADPVSDQVRDAARSFGDSLNRKFGDPAPAPAPQPAEPMSSAGDDEAVAQVSALMRSRYGFPGGESSRSEGGGGGLGARPIHVTMIANQYNLADPLSQYASPEDLS